MRARASHKGRLLAAAFLAAACTTGLAAPSYAGTLLTLGAAPLGGTYYPAAVAIADIITKHVPGTDVRVEVTGGTMENPALMQQGELQLGLANADAAFFAFYGKSPFGAPLGDLRALFIGLAPGVVHYAVTDESGIVTIKDLAGKCVAVGPQGNSSGLLFTKILNFYGLRDSDLTRSFVSFSDGVNELVDGHVDMAVVQAGLPAPALQEAFAGRQKIRILSFPEDERDAFLREYPYYIPATIPKSAYRGMDADVTTLATQNMVLVHASLPEELVYAITKAIFEHLPELHAAHPSLRAVTLEAAGRSPIPLHEGALRYFRQMAALP